MSFSSQSRQQNNCRKRLKRALKSAGDEWDDTAPDRTPPFTEDTQTEEMQEDAQYSHSSEEAYCQTTKVNLLSHNLLLYSCVYIIIVMYNFFFKQDLAATDHTYALLDPCTTKARLFDVIDANSWLQKRVQTKCRLIKRMKVKLQDVQRELLTLRRQLRYRHYTYRQRHPQLPI